MAGAHEEDGIEAVRVLTFLHARGFGRLLALAVNLKIPVHELESFVSPRNGAPARTLSPDALERVVKEITHGTKAWDAERQSMVETVIPATTFAAARI